MQDGSTVFGGYVQAVAARQMQMSVIQPAILLNICTLDVPVASRLLGIYAAAREGLQLSAF